MIHCILSVKHVRLREPVFFIFRLPDCPVAVLARFGERKYRSRQARMIFFQPTPQGPDLDRVHRTRDYLCRVGNKIHGSVLCMVCGDSLPDLFAIAGQKMYFCNSNFSFMENYIKKAADAFLVERPYGMRVDYRKKGFVLFNRNLNVLGNAEQTRLEELPLERFNVEEIPLEGEVVEEHSGFTDVFFYTDLTNPYAGYVLNLQKLKAYNRLMFPLAMALNREL